MDHHTFVVAAEEEHLVYQFVFVQEGHGPGLLSLDRGVSAYWYAYGFDSEEQRGCELQRMDI